MIILIVFPAQVLETPSYQVPSKFQDNIQIGNDKLVHPDHIKGHRYQERPQKRPNGYGVSLQILDSDHELENVVEIIEEGDEDITDLRRHATTPQSQKSYFEKSQVRINNTFPSIYY